MQLGVSAHAGVEGKVLVSYVDLFLFLDDVLLELLRVLHCEASCQEVQTHDEKHHCADDTQVELIQQVLSEVAQLDTRSMHGHQCDDGCEED